MCRDDGEHLHGRITTGVGSVVTSVQPAARAQVRQLDSEGPPRECAALLKNEASFVAKLSAGKGKRDTANTKADTKFRPRWTASSPTAARPRRPPVRSHHGRRLHHLTNTIISPNVDDTQFTRSRPVRTTASYAGES